MRITWDNEADASAKRLGYGEPSISTDDSSSGSLSILSLCSLNAC